MTARRRPRAGAAQRKRGRPRLGSQRALTRERILSTALEISRADGLEQLSMRRLAQALEVDSASLYWHFPNKRDLLEAALTQASSEITLREPPAGPWRERCTAFSHELRETLRASPDVLRIQDQASVLTPFVVHASRILIDVLAATGLRGEELVLSAQTVLWQIIGMARLEAGASQTPPPAEVVDEVRRLTVPTATPGLDLGGWQSVADAYSGLSFTRLFDHAIEKTLDGIEHGLSSPTSTTSSGKRR